MVNLDQFRSQGWYLSEEGVSELQKPDSSNDVSTLIRRALDVDLREIGASILSSELNQPIFGPVVLQILKVRNISAPKSKPTSQGAPRMLKLSLTDGQSNCQGIEIKNISGLSLERTAPGTKILINGAQVVSGCLLLEQNSCKVLGGNVTHLVEKWQLSKIMPNHIRVNEDGPPPWVNFGMKIINTVGNQGFKSLDNKNKDGKEDVEFQEQRKEAIEAIQGAVKKVFGGGVRQPSTFNPDHNQYNATRAPRPPRKPRERNEMEKMEKPLQKVSLFNFLEDKLPQNELEQIKNAEMKANNFQTKMYEDRSNDRGSRNKFSGNSSRPNYRDNNYRDNTNYRDNKPKSYSNNYRQEESTKYEGNKHSSDARYNYNPKYSEQNTRYSQDNRHTESNARYAQDNSRYNVDNSKNNMDNGRYNADYISQFPLETPHFNETKYTSENPRYPDSNSRYNSEGRFHNEKPPRFQKQRNETPSTPKFPSAQTEQKSKPKTNIFVDKIAQEINNISLYNHKYESEKLMANKPPEDTNAQWNWKSGDRCLAKYWEDNKFYNAVVIEVTNRTCMVEFLDYGNFEEVLHCDCIPITSEKEDEEYIQTSPVHNQDKPSNSEHKRSRNRPFVKSARAVGNQFNNS